MGNSDHGTTYAYTATMALHIRIQRPWHYIHVYSESRLTSSRRGWSQVFEVAGSGCMVHSTSAPVIGVLCFKSFDGGPGNRVYFQGHAS